MQKTKFIISLILTFTVLTVQVGAVKAAPALKGAAPVAGTVQSITLDTDTNTGMTVVLVNVLDKHDSVQTARISPETAITLGLVRLDGDGNPAINNSALGQAIEINPEVIIPDEESDRHPVGRALATFFSDITGVDYDKIMAAHDDGFGFGVIAQALWLTTKLEGSSDIFDAILQAKQTGDYSSFILDDGTIPMNWGQLRKAILEDKEKGNLGLIMSGKNNGNSNGNPNGSGQANRPDKDKNKEKDNSNNGNGKPKNK